uniref:Cell division cycle protein 20 n=1 Tax=Arundo donax TaxID=35708 RepID=A0A0A9DIV8_ARUDO
MLPKKQKTKARLTTQTTNNSTQKINQKFLLQNTKSIRNQSRD